MRSHQCGRLGPVILANRASKQAELLVFKRKAKRTDMHCGFMRQTATATVVFSDGSSASRKRTPGRECRT